MVTDVSVRLEKLVLLPCLLLLLKVPTSDISLAAILVILSFSKHCERGIPNTRPTGASAKITEKKTNISHDFLEK